MSIKSSYIITSDQTIEYCLNPKVVVKCRPYQLDKEICFNGFIHNGNTPCLKKNCASVIVNNSVKHWPNLIIFGTQHHEEMRHKRPCHVRRHQNT